MTLAVSQTTIGGNMPNISASVACSLGRKTAVRPIVHSIHPKRMKNGSELANVKCRNRNTSNGLGEHQFFFLAKSGFDNT